MLICVPDPDDVDLLGELPPGVEAVAWDGNGAPPAAADEVEFLVAPYGVPTKPAELIAGLPHLKVVQLLSAGVDAWLDKVPETVVLCRGVGVHSASTADLALALILASVRRLDTYAHQQREHRWEYAGADEMTGKRVLMVGAGEIGQAIARRLEAFDATVTFVGRTARGDVHGTNELPALLPLHDIVMLIIPLTDETRGMVDAAFLAAMPAGALLVNVARGPIVVTEALAAELRTGRLYAALDVTDPEPLPADHPLWTVPNLIITPHVGGGTPGWAERGFRLVADQLRRYVTGEELAYVVEGRY